MKPPIVLAAFGTSTRAKAAYDVIDAAYREAFPGHEILWAYTSRTVASKVNKRSDEQKLHPEDVMEMLAGQGREWAVVQSLHLAWGHEFFRLKDDVQHEKVRASMGLPLLTSPEDCMEVAEDLARFFDSPQDEAQVFVGHGTDHPAWAMFTAMGSILKDMYGDRAFMGVLEEGYPDRDVLISKLLAQGYKKARLIPFLLVSGMHFAKDLAGKKDSWKIKMEEAGIQATPENIGLGQSPAVVRMFVRHTQKALDLIPLK
ncbi:sirohydrochlorin cobaltochelatase [Desulfatibacillum alkenivorans DSM 16219]|jgi:sirohydrochlorin cobaltochelatase|uniref:Sirohydrochlorin cobaltochelatase n=1 Tax=Desulfatibacillum alkenivorans DSM 16219 TaxID=1121393 RepID=A0A1M7BDM1_9BACT|nr:sirohydrochlorin cobaltochelatase [Desulfatibacillum alkenivorans]SHL53110.1 sirohydrochlorin cobaltochelatase [Desulfatibacillum alkenivorans DSM 16219]